ncbi:MAG TPA: hypothetical protein VFS50_17395 [Meiothermus sp.]|jgi:hypothetical protein|nr:hypothetical protein [Meiothermus sp.]
MLLGKLGYRLLGNLYQTLDQATLASAPLVLLIISGLSLAQPAGLSGRLESWPPPGWPQGTSAQLRLGFEGSQGPASPLAAIGADGRFTLSLEAPTVPADAWGSLARALRLEPGCNFTPMVNPVGARAAIASLKVFAAGRAEPWGELRIEQRGKRGNDDTGEISFLIYVDRAATVRGSGTCGGGIAVQVDERIRQGWNVVVVSGTFTPSGGTATIKVTGSPIGRFEILPLGR